MKKRLNLKIEKETTFKDVNHIKNHIDYLFRCDENQKWSNNLTKNNFVIYLENENKGKIVFYDKTLEELSKEAEITRNKVLIRNDFLENGRKLRIDLIDGNSKFDEDDLIFSQMVFESMVVSEGIEPICLVGHQDQDNDYLHWHLLYINQTGEDFGKKLNEG